MTSTIGLKSPDWAIYKSEYAVIDSFPLMSSPVPVALIWASYLLFVLKIGPNFMKNRKPFNLNNTLIIYNAVQVVYSVFLVQKSFTFIFRTSMLFHSKCLIKDEVYQEEIISFVWLYFLAKMSELLDTVFFVLRKKTNQITFLHVYHHSTMLIGTWSCLKYEPSENFVVICNINSIVHVIMYSYYGLAAMGPQVAKYLTWKKYITTMQLVQFLGLISYYLTSIIYSECPPSKGIAVFVTFNIVAFFFLFGNFYQQNYIKSNKEDQLKKEKQNGLTEKTKAHLL